AARTLANLAELRHSLGLFEHAQHAVTFGRRALGPGMPAARASHFSVVAARIALSRGNTVDAHREISAAIADGKTAGDRDYLGEAYRMAARVALEDGDLARAGEALARATELATREGAQAEIALLKAI